VNRVDVVIVGAGPSGLVAAIRLAELGFSLEIVDALPLPAPESRAALMHAASVEILARIGVGEVIVAAGQRVDAITIADRGRMLARIPFDRLKSPFPFALGIPQNTTEEILTARLAALGHTVTRGRRVTEIAQDGEGCTVSGTSDGSAESWTVRSEYLIGADGKNSTVRTAAGIAFPGDSYEEEFLLADVALEPTPGPANEARIAFSPDGVTVIGRLPSGRHRVIATLMAGPEVPRHPDRAYLDRLLATRRIGTATAAEPVWSSRFRIGHQLAESFQRGRLFLCGDAAHVHSPAAGQGMNTGIADAFDLADRLGRERHGEPGAIDGYGQARRAAAQEVIGFTDRLTRAALLQQPVARTIRNAAVRVVTRIPAVRGFLVSLVSGIQRSPLRQQG
jgi:2-polyprenyl-6-methoxyphenol hydroxylase-like FAD-dependent oxidoreductase